MKLPVHTVSAAALIARGDEVLLIKNPRRGWEFPGGMVEQGESVIEALKREIMEETGVQVKVTAFVGAYSNMTLKEGYGELAGTMLPTSFNLTFLCEYAVTAPPQSFPPREFKPKAKPRAAAKRKTESSAAAKPKAAAPRKRKSVSTGTKSDS